MRGDPREDEDTGQERSWCLDVERPDRVREEIRENAPENAGSVGNRKDVVRRQAMHVESRGHSPRLDEGKEDKEAQESQEHAEPEKAKIYLKQ